MAKPKKKNKQNEETVVEPELVVVSKPSLFSFLPTIRAQSIFLVLLGFAFYFNTILNEYALDDDIVIVKNQYVQSGFGGIGKIMSKDAFDSFYRQMQATGQLAGGRYRPLSIVSFAIEQQLFGECNGKRMAEIQDTLGRFTFTDPGYSARLSKELGDLEASTIQSNLAVAGIRHFVNVALFLLSMVVLLHLLRNYFFKENPDLAFLTTLLFLIHPIHTEVIANVKSRDEIMSFLFICLTFIYIFRWQARQGKYTLIKALGCYFLALLSKEWGITLVFFGLIPLSLYLFRKQSGGSAITATMPFLAVAVFYLLLRIKFVGLGSGEGDKELLNNYYLLASPIQKLATKLFVLSKYLFLLFLPVHLSADYSFNTIHYRSFSDWDVWLSLAIHITMVVAAVRLIRKQHWLAFAIVFYLAHLFMVSNLVFNIGASMGERLIYHSSLGFSLVLAWALLELTERISAENMKKALIFGTLVPVIALSGFKNIERNSEWKSDHTLFIHDAKVVPESVMANGNAGKSFIELSDEAKANKDTALGERYLDSALFYLARSFKNHPTYYIGYLNMGYVYYRRQDYDKCEFYWNKAAGVFPRAGHAGFWKKYDDPLAEVFHVKGNNAGLKKDFKSAAMYLEKAVTYAPQNSTYWADYGGANYELKDYQKALDCWTKALQIDPSNQGARGGYKALSGKDWK
jgi:hypothetical protein